MPGEKCGLDAILARLREAKLVKTLRGPGGGYALSRPPEEISVEEVVKVLEGGLVMVPCLDDLQLQQDGGVSDQKSMGNRFIGH